MTPSAAAGKSRLATARRVVVKIGSALLVERSTGRVNRSWLEALAEDVARLRGRGQEVVLVSSGAIALGRRQLGLAPGKLRLEESQAAAAVGQIRLAHAWKEVLEQHGFTVAQVLLTLGDTEQRRRYLNARNTLTALLRLGAIPVINENDTVATAEIRYGDNDRLAARVAQMVSADCLVLLSDVDGLYTADPTRDTEAKFISEVPRITAEIEAMAGGSASDVGSGGMATKVLAAKIAVAAGCHMCVPAGREQHPLRRIESGLALHVVRGRRLASDRAQAVDRRHAEARGRAAGGRGGGQGAQAGQEPAASRRRAGQRALRSRRRGRRQRTRRVVRWRVGSLPTRAMTPSASCGRKSGELEELLGYRGRDEMIHRDDLVIVT